MIGKLLRDDTNFEGVDSSGKKSATRYLVYSCEKGDSSMVLAESNLIPQIRDAHPEYSGWTVESIGAPKYDSVEPKFLFTVKYTWGGNSSGGGGSSGENASVEPWKLGPQNVKTSVFDKEQVIEELWDTENKKWIPLINSAGCRLILNGSLPVMQLSFTKNYKHTSGKWKEVNTKFSINDRSITVCNVNIGAYCGKLHPFTPELHTVYENDGKTVRWEYESINFVIDILTDERQTWMQNVLNVGRLARFERNGKLSSPEPIFSYTPWKSADDIANMKTDPEYGGITEVMAAQTAYQKVLPAGKSGKIPYSQVDEELPLNKDGTINIAAMKDPEKNPYGKISGFTVIPESWNKYDLPRSV